MSTPNSPATGTAVFEPGAGSRRPSISIVTLLWRNESHVPAFLRSLGRAVAAASATVELVALANGPDGAAATAVLRAAGAPPGVELRLLERDENLGFAGGMNEGCRAARGDTLVLANLDLEFDEGFVAALERAAAAPRPGPALLAPSVHPAPGATSGDGEHGVARISAVHRLRRAEARPGRLVPVPAGNGCCVVLPRPVYEWRRAAAGGVFDPEYHSYYEDVDLFWWARDRGVAVLFDPGLKVRHLQGGSFGGRFRFADRTPDIQASVMANYRLTVWKHARRPGQVTGWLAGEAGYVALCLRAGGLRGLAPYLASWRQARDRAVAIRRRRGRLREPAGPLTGRRVGPAGRGAGS